MGNLPPRFGDADLSDCAKEPIQTPGSIQPHGVLLVLASDTFEVLQLGGDTEKLLGLAPCELLGQSLRVLLGPAALQRLDSLKVKDQIFNRPFFVFQTMFGDAQLDVSAHVNGGLLILELEPRHNSSSDGIEIVQSMLSRLMPHTTMDELLPAMASEVRLATGYDRVMVYRFLEDDNGQVVAESRREDATDSLLNLHYPASDIPAQARELYRRNWMRCVPDAQYKPLPLQPINNPQTDLPLDLSFSTLRSVSPLHLEYLANMGVRSSMSMSIIVGERLWGLIVCHAAKPIYLDSRLRGALELFAQLSSLQLRSQIELQHTAEEVCIRNILNSLILSMNRDSLQTALIGARPNLLDFIPASGVTVRYEGKNFSMGNVPDDHQINGLMNWLDATISEGVYATHQLADAYPAAADFTGLGAGLLAVSVSQLPRDYVLWFLPELLNAVTWAGDPYKPIEMTAAGNRRAPRKSFDAWRETIMGQSRRWRKIETESAALLRISILEVANVESRVWMEKRLIEQRNDLESERIVAALARQRLDERFRRVVEASPNAMIMIRDNGQIEMVNVQAELDFCYTREEMLEQPIWMLMPQRFSNIPSKPAMSFFDAAKWRLNAAGRDLFGLRKDGTAFSVEIGLSPIETDEGTMTLATIVDVSDRKQKEARVQVALREKEVLLAEIHHRVKNNLQVIHSLLELQSSKIKDASALALLAESQGRIRSMALIHQTLNESKDFAEVKFKTFLNNLLPALLSTYNLNRDRIEIVINAGEIALPLDAAIPCGLIINELVSNALKHGFNGDKGGQIIVELSYALNNEIILSVSDNGAGIPIELDIINANTLGLQLVSLLADQLRAALTVSRSNPTGFRLQFPIGR